MLGRLRAFGEELRLQSKSYMVEVDVNRQFQIWWKKPEHSTTRKYEVRVPISHRLILPAKVWNTGDQEWYVNGQIVKSRYHLESWEIYNIG